MVLPSGGARAGPEARFAATDVTDEASVARAPEVAADLGPVRVAVCRPGIDPPGRVLGGQR